MLVEEDVERGGKEQTEHEIQDDFAYRNNVHNADIRIRMGNCATLQEFKIISTYIRGECIRDAWKLRTIAHFRL